MGTEPGQSGKEPKQGRWWFRAVVALGVLWAPGRVVVSTLLDLGRERPFLNGTLGIGAGEVRQVSATLLAQGGAPGQAAAWDRFFAVASVGGPQPDGDGAVLFEFWVLTEASEYGSSVAVRRQVEVSGAMPMSQLTSIAPRRTFSSLPAAWQTLVIRSITSGAVAEEFNWRGLLTNAGERAHRAAIESGAALAVLFGARWRWRRWSARLGPGVCRSCGYPVAGLPAGRCPECGAEVGAEGRGGS